MITEDYINFETAKLLKEKGFDESVTHYYFTQITHVGFKDYPTGVLYTDSDPQHQNNYKNKVAAPTQALVMKWLREVHKIQIYVKQNPYDAWHYWGFSITYINDKINELPNQTQAFIHIPPTKLVNDCYKTYEQACEVAIKYCLENLI